MKKTQVKISFPYPSKNGYQVEIVEDQQVQENLKNILVILRVDKPPIYIKNLPKHWLDCIETATLDIRTFNPSRRSI